MLDLPLRSMTTTSSAMPSSRVFSITSRRVFGAAAAMRGAGFARVMAFTSSIVRPDPCARYRRQDESGSALQNERPTGTGRAPRPAERKRRGSVPARAPPAGAQIVVPPDLSILLDNRKAGQKPQWALRERYVAIAPNGGSERDCPRPSAKRNGCGESGA